LVHHLQCFRFHLADVIEQLAAAQGAKGTASGGVDLLGMLRANA
jgi:hypothetical protein